MENTGVKIKMEVCHDFVFEVSNQPFRLIIQHRGTTDRAYAGSCFLGFYLRALNYLLFLFVGHGGGGQ